MSVRSWNIISLHQVAFGAAPDNDLSPLSELHGDVFGLTQVQRTKVPTENVEEISWAVGPLGQTFAVELDDLRSIDRDGPNKVYKRSGIHHIAFFVDNLSACHHDLKAKEFEITDRRMGSKGHEMFFLLPAKKTDSGATKDGLGTLYEFVQASSPTLALYRSLEHLASHGQRSTRVGSHFDSLSSFLTAVRKRAQELRGEKPTDDSDNIKFDIIRFSDISPIVIIFYFLVIPVLAVLWLSIFLSNVPVTGLIIGLLLGAGALLTLRQILRRHRR